MPGLEAGIHVWPSARKTGMAGTSPEDIFGTRFRLNER
jgi:hypothetical protein